MFEAVSLLICLLIGVCAGQSFPATLPIQVDTLLSSDQRCTTSEFQTNPWKQDTFTQYTSSFSGAKGVCYLSDFVKPCATLTGAVGCNKYDSKCESINSKIDFQSSTLHPEIVSVMTARPSICVSQGSFLHPDAVVYTIVLIIIGWLLLVALLVYVMQVFKALQPGIFLNILLVSTFVLSTLLLFSYYYLNGVVVLGCMYLAYMLFSVRRADCTAFGFFILLGGMLWTMHAAALGWAQHMSRFGDGATATSTSMCINYYRGYFAYPTALQGDFENPVVNSKELCRREWIGAELFFMILLQLLMLLAVVAGAAVRKSRISVKPNKPSTSNPKEAA